MSFWTARGALRLYMALCLLTVLACTPRVSLTQEHPAPTWMRETSALALNTVLGGLTAGITSEMRGGSFADGFTRGAFGGAVMYGGKRVAVEGFPGAGLVGRQIAAVGISAIRNASDGLGMVERVVLPFGPVRLYVWPGTGAIVAARVDLVTLAAVAYAVVVPELEVAPAQSLSSGAPVFVVENALIRNVLDDTVSASGRTRAGAMYVSRIAGLDFQRDLAHERVHVIQNDFIFLAWTDRLEDRAVKALPAGTLLNRYVDLNLSPLVTTSLSLAFKNYRDRPWEVEARFLSER